MQDLEEELAEMARAQYEARRRATAMQRTLTTQLLAGIVTKCKYVSAYKRLQADFRAVERRHEVRSGACNAAKACGVGVEAWVLIIP